MIQVLNYPETDRLLLDGNNTNIKIRSTNGSGYYFRAEIYIDDALFDTQSWSREDTYTATKDLVYLYNAYFKTQFLEAFSSGLVEQTHLIKKVNITVKEYTTENDTLIETLELPDFYIMYNLRSATFSDDSKITILGLDAITMRAPKTGKIVIPFFINADAEALTVTATLDDDTEIDSVTAAALTGKKVYLYTLDLSETAIAYANLYIDIKIALGETEVIKQYTIIRNPDFTVKELVFCNNFGFFIPAYFTGELATTSGYKTFNYENLDGQDITYAIDHLEKYSINTSYLNTNENPIVNQIAKAIEVYFKNGSDYLAVTPKTQRSEDLIDKEHVYNTKLQFEFKQGFNTNNDGFLVAPTCLDIEITGNENETTTIATSLFTTAFDPNTLNKITFTELPENGVLYYVLFGLPITVAIGEEYNFADIDEFRFTAPAEDFGDDYDAFKFQVRDGLLYSNEATAVIDITEVPPGPQPPTIVAPQTALLRLVAGDGNVTIPATVTDPDDDLNTILWEFEGTPHANTVISDETTATPTVTITSGAAGTFQIKCTATDDAANSSVAYVTILATSHVIEIEEERLAESDSGSDTDRIHEIIISNGIENETVDLIFTYDVYDSLRYVLADYGEDTEKLISLLNRKRSFTYTFDVSGEIRFFILMEDNDTEEHAALEIQAVKPTGDVTIDTENDTIEI